MDIFPLTPFFELLNAKGFRFTIRDYERISLVLKARGPWTLKQFRQVLVALLVREPDQEELLVRQFNQFFDANLDPENKFPEINIDRALDDFHKLAQSQSSRFLARWEGPARLPQHDKQIPALARLLVWLKFFARPRVKAFGLVLILSFVAYLIGADKLKQAFEFIKSLVVRASWRAILPLIIAIPTIMLTILVLARVLKKSKPMLWFTTALKDLILGLAKVLKEGNPLNRAPLRWNPSAPRHFPMGRIGGEPSPQLDSSTLDYLADSMGYFQSYQLTSSLDLKATVKATIENAGIPTLAYKTQKRPRAVIVLEDAFSESLIWNRTSKELVDGLNWRGVPILYGSFSRSLTQFRTSAGAIHHLDGLENDRSGYLLLIFSDGQSFHESFVLEALARWPMIGWMELREPRFWDEATTRPAQLGIPVYPANASGIRFMTDRFLKEQGPQADSSRGAAQWRGIPSSFGKDLDAYLEELLGDALPWAQECAILQPLSIGLADALRRQFHCNLPPERIERIFMIPETNYSVAGLRFGKSALNALRSGFPIRRSIDEQRQVLEFILEQIMRAEPPERDSLAHMAWEWTFERVRLSLEPRKALIRLRQLANSPLADAINEELKESEVVKLSEWEFQNIYKAAVLHLEQGQYMTALEIVEGGLASANSEELHSLKELIEGRMRSNQN